jgi:hypothetical protein
MASIPSNDDVLFIDLQFNATSTTKEINGVIKDTGRLEASFDKLGATIDKSFNKVNSSIRNVGRDLNKSLKNIDLNIGQVNKSFRDFEKLLTRFHSEAQFTRKELAQINIELKNMVKNSGSAKGSLADFAKPVLAEEALRRGAPIWFQKVSHLQEKRARVSAWNLSPELQKQWRKQTQDLLANNLMMSKADAEAAMMAASSSIGHYDPNIVGRTVGSVAKYAQLEKALGYNKSEVDDIIKNYYGVAEARQVTGNIQKVLDTFKTVFRITTTTAGKISVADVETILRNMGPGAGTITDEGLLNLLAYAEQIKVAGRGMSGSTGAGISTVGTNVKMLQLMAMGKPTGKNAKNQLAQLGILDDDVYSIDKVRNVGGALLRGSSGQVLEQATINSANLMAASAWNKKLAQEDPVKWVEQLIPLVEQYTAQKRNRAKYYGSYAYGKENVNDKEFLGNLSETQKLSAITTFWAATGLSQRVLQALTTFSNENFIKRSTEMMKTAQNQKSAEQLMQEQIDAGNLNLSLEILKKSFDRLIESTESFAPIVANLMVKTAELLRYLGDWSDKSASLVKMTMSVFAMKGLNAAIGRFSQQFNLVAVEEIERAKKTNILKIATDKLIHAFDALHFSVVKQITGSAPSKTASYRINAFVGEKITAKIKSVTDFVKTQIIGIGMLFAKTISGIGTALIALDLASMFLDWWAASSELGRQVRDMINGFGDYCVDMFSKLFAWLGLNRPDQTIGLSKDESEKKKSLEKQISDKQSELNNLIKQRDEANGDLDNNKYFSDDRVKELTTEIEKLTAQLATLNEKSAQAEEETKKAEEVLTKFFSENLNNDSIQAKYKSVEELSGRKDRLLKEKEAAEKFGLSKEEIKRRTAAWEQAKKEYDDALEKITKDTFGQFVQGSSEVGEAIKNLDEKGLSRLKEVIYKQMEIFYSAIDPSGELVNEFRNNWKARLSNLLGSTSTTFVNGLQAVAQYAIPEVSKTVSAKRAGKYRGENGLPEFPNGKSTNNGKTKRTFTPRRRYVQSYDNVQKILSRDREEYSKEQYKLGRYSELESYDDTLKRIRENFIKDVMGGRVRNKKGESYFIKNKKKAKQETFSEKDINLGLTYDRKTGATGEDLVRQLTKTERLKAFNSAFGTMFKQANKAVETATRSLTESERLLDEENDFSSLPPEIRKFEEEVADNFKKITKTFGDTLESSKKAADALNKYKEDTQKQLQLMSLRLANEQTKKWQDDNKIRQRSFLTSREAATGEFLDNYRKIGQTYKSTYDAVVEKNRNNINNPQTQQTLTQLTQTYREQAELVKREYYERVQGYSQKYLNQLVEDWKDVGSQIQNLQSTMMDGFVTATENWLDGSESSWRDYANNVLKQMRSMFLKVGFADLLGSGVKDFSESVQNFTRGIFGQQVTYGQEGSKAFDFGSSIWNWLTGKGFKPTETTNMTQSIDDKIGMAQKIGGMDGNTMAVTTNTEALIALTSAITGKAPTLGLTNNISNGTTAFDQAKVWLGMDEGDDGDSWRYADDPTAGGVLSQDQLGTETPTLANTMGQMWNNFEDWISTFFSGDFLTKIGSTFTGLFNGDFFSNIGDWFGGLFDGGEGGMFSNLTDKLSGMFDGLSEDLGKSIGDIGGMLGSAVSTLFGGGEKGQIAGTVVSVASKVIGSFFADGGIMTSRGRIPLNKYANGGIARKAQMAVFGEGATPEAYVPLPDGHSIPVTINGGMGMSESAGGNQFNISISVVNNSESQSQSGEGSSAEQSSNITKFANNIKAIVKSEIVNQSRPGGLLYNGR